MLTSFPVFRVQWLRAKAAKDRFQEEVTLLEAEMGWTISYFHHQSVNWKSAHNVAKNNDTGRACLAARECAMWELMKENAERLTQRFKIARVSTNT